MFRPIALSLVMAFSTPAFAEPEKGAIAELEAALKAAAGAKSYAWTSEQSPGPQSEPVKAEYERDKPLHVIADKLECYRKGNEVVYFEKEWTRSRTGTLSDPLRILGPVSQVRSLTLPHEELAAIAGSRFKADLKVEAPSKTQKRFTFALEEESVRKLTPSQYVGVAKEGKAEVTIENGNVVRYRTEIRLQGTIGNAEIDGTAVHEVTLNGVNRTTVMPPEAAAKLLESKQ